MVPTFSSFEAIYHKGHFRKSLTQIFKFSCFYWYHAYFFEKNELDFLMQNLMLNQLAPILSRKKEKGKLVCLLFWDQFNYFKVFSFFPNYFGQLGNFFRHIFFFADQPCSKGTCLLYGPKIYIKKSCNYSASTTMQNIFLDSLCFLGRNLLQIWEHPSSKASANNKKKLFWFVYTRLHSSTFIYIDLDSSTDSSTFV